MAPGTLPTDRTVASIDVRLAMHEKNAEDDSRAMVSNRTMEIVVALLLLGGAATVISDSMRLGFGWQEGVGPAPGYFPFWVAVILGLSSLVTLVAAALGH